MDKICHFLVAFRILYLIAALLFAFRVVVGLCNPQNYFLGQSILSLLINFCVRIHCLGMFDL